MSITPRCRHCNRAMVFESPLFGGPDEWRCTYCGEGQDAPGAPGRPRAASPATLGDQGMGRIATTIATLSRSALSTPVIDEAMASTCKECGDIGSRWANPRIS